MKIIVRSNETANGDYLGDVVAEFSAPTQAECDAWVAEHYDINDYTCSYS